MSEIRGDPAVETEATGVSLEKVVECQRSEVTLRLRRAERMNRVDVMRHRELDNGSCVQFYSDVLSALQTSHVVCVLIQRSKFVSSVRACNEWVHNTCTDLTCMPTPTHSNGKAIVCRFTKQ